MTDAAAPAAAVDPADPAPGSPVVPPFSPRKMRAQLTIDALLRAAALAAVIAAAVFVFFYDGGADWRASLGVFAIFFVWLAMGTVSAGVTRRLPLIAATTETDPRGAEAMLAEALRKRTLMRWVRLMLYHRLAVLRHKQGRYEEASAICAAVLQHPLGPGETARPHLLLMLAEARLQLADPAGAWPALLQLHFTRLSLVESLQRMALQTRYEIAAGHPAAAARAADRKAALAELMPAAQCGAMHAMLAAAARATRQPDLAAWLWRRAELLCTPEQLARLARGGFGIPVVQPWEPAVTPTP